MGIISLGSCNKKFIYLYLISLVISIGLIRSLINSFIYTPIYGYGGYYDDFTDNKANNILLKVFLSYIGQSLFFIMQLILVKCSSKNERGNIAQKKIKRTSAIKFIFNDMSDILTNKDLINILIFSFILLFIDISKAIIEQDIELNIILHYYIYQIFFIFILSQYFYGIKFYKHQKCSIIFIIISDIILSISLFWLTHIKLERLNFLKVALHITCSFLESLFIIYSKGLMELKFFSPYKATYVFGFINTFILLIIYFIISKIQCNCDDNIICPKIQEPFLDNSRYLCKLLYNDAFYFDNIESAFRYKYGKISKYIFMIISSILLGCISLIYNIVINKYTVCHIFLFQINKEIILYSLQLYSIFYILTKGLRIEIGNLDESSDYIKLIISIIYIIVLSLIFFTILVFLEFIELNCFGLNKNTKKNIMKREIEDLNEINGDNESFLTDEEANS